MPVYRALRKSTPLVTPSIDANIDSFAQCHVVNIEYDENSELLHFYGTVNSSSRPVKYDVEVAFSKVEKTENLTIEEIREGFKPKPNLLDHEIMFRCNCDSYWSRFYKANHFNSATIGAPFRKGRNRSGRKSYNPNNIPGCCKHIIEFITYLQEQGFIL